MLNVRLISLPDRHSGDERLAVVDQQIPIAHLAVRIEIRRSAEALQERRARQHRFCTRQNAPRTRTCRSFRATRNLLHCAASLRLVVRVRCEDTDRRAKVNCPLNLKLLRAFLVFVSAIAAKMEATVSLIDAEFAINSMNHDTRISVTKFNPAALAETIQITNSTPTQTDGRSSFQSIPSVPWRMWPPGGKTKSPKKSVSLIGKSFRISLSLISIFTQHDMFPAGKCPTLTIST